MPAIDLKNCTIKIKDGTTPTANEVIVKVGEGNLTWTETKNREYKLDGGKLDTTRNGDEAPMDVSLDLQFEYYKGITGTITPIDALKKIGDASSWISSETTDSCAPYAVTIEVENDPGCGVANSVETFTFPFFRYESIGGDIKAGTLAVKGKCNATEPTVVRSSPTT